MNICSSSQLTFIFGSFLGQDMALESLATFDCSTWTNAKTLLRAALGFHFWHDTRCPFRQFRFFTITGGSKTLLLDACTRFLLATASRPSHPEGCPSAPRLFGENADSIKNYFFFLGASTITICRPSIFGNCSI
jgi:hypothetical protein